MDVLVRRVASVGLVAGAAYHIQNEANWWLYVPAYLLAAFVCFLPLPSSRLWRILSAFSIVGGGLLMLFLRWTFITLEYTIAVKPTEARNILPVAIGVALSTTTRISTDSIQSPIHYIRTLILVLLLALSIQTIITSAKYF